MPRFPASLALASAVLLFAPWSAHAQIPWAVDVSTPDLLTSAIASSGQVFDLFPPGQDFFGQPPNEVMPSGMCLGPMGFATAYVEPLGSGNCKIHFEMDTKAGWTWYSMTGFVFVQYYDPMRNWGGPLYTTIIQGITFGTDQHYQWASPVLHVRPGCVVMVSFCASGLGSQNWGPAAYPVIWNTPVLCDFKYCL